MTEIEQLREFEMPTKQDQCYWLLVEAIEQALPLVEKIQVATHLSLVHELANSIKARLDLALRVTGEKCD